MLRSTISNAALRSSNTSINSCPLSVERTRSLCSPRTVVSLQWSDMHDMQPREMSRWFQKTPTDETIYCESNGHVTDHTSGDPCGKNAGVVVGIVKGCKVLTND